MKSSFSQFPSSARHAPRAQRSKLFLLALCPLLFALCASSARAQTYSDTTFIGSVHTQGWASISGISLTVTNGGYQTNLYVGTNLIARTNYYRLSATNQAGRIPASTNIWISFLGSSSLSNAVQLTWTRPGGVQRQVIEKSYDAGSTWTNWLSILPNTNTWLDTGSNTWTAGVFSNSVSAIPAATYPWPSSSDFSALAETAGVTRIIASAASNLAAAASAASGSNTAWLASLAPSQAVDRAWLTAITPSQQVDRAIASAASNLAAAASASADGATVTGQLAYALSFSRSWDSIGFASYAASNADTCAWGAWASPVYVSNVWLQVDSPGAGDQTIAGRLDLVAEGTSLLAATSNLWSGLSAGTNGAAFNASTNGGIVPPGWCPVWVCTNISAIAVQQYRIRLQTWKP